jgi:hypothetical protein
MTATPFARLHTLDAYMKEFYVRKKFRYEMNSAALKRKLRGSQRAFSQGDRFCKTNDWKSFT